MASNDLLKTIYNNVIDNKPPFNDFTKEDYLVHFLAYTKDEVEMYVKDHGEDSLKNVMDSKQVADEFISDCGGFLE